MPESPARGLAAPSATSPATRPAARPAPGTARPATAPRVRFAVVGYPRSGSTLLVRLLHSHPNAWVYSEIFSRGADVDEAAAGWNQAVFERVFTHGIHRRPRRANRGEHLTDFATEPFASDASDASDAAAAPDTSKASGAPDAESIRAVGYKHLLPRDWKRAPLKQRLRPKRPNIARTPRRFLIADPSVRILFLERRNALARLLSLRHLQNRDRPNSFDPAERTRTKLRVTREELSAFVAEEARTTRKVQHALRRHPRLDLSYEDLSNDEATIDRVLRFLDLPPAQLAARTVKLDPRPFSESIENYTELRDACAGSALARFFETD